MNSQAARLGCLIGLAALALLTVEAAWQGLVAARAFPGNMARDAWLPSPARTIPWEQAYDGLAAAVRRDGGNALLSENFVSLLLERARQPGLDYHQRILLWRAALDVLRTSVRQRPTLPFAWGGIALLKSQLGQFDGEFATALRRTAELGPAEPNLQRIAVEVGFGAWYLLGSDERMAVTGMLRRGLEMDRPGMVNTIRQSRRQWAVCESAELQALLPEFSCRS